MNNRIPYLMYATAISCLLVGCSQTSTYFVSETPENEQTQVIEYIEADDLKWLNYSDPTADANLAIEKQDFTLLAVAGEVIFFPGISELQAILQQQCGYRLLANSSDALHSKDQLNLHKKLYQYAATYNQLVAAACSKK